LEFCNAGLVQKAKIADLQNVKKTYPMYLVTEVKNAVHSAHLVFCRSIILVFCTHPALQNSKGNSSVGN